MQVEGRNKELGKLQCAIWCRQKPTEGIALDLTASRKDPARPHLEEHRFGDSLTGTCLDNSSHAPSVSPWKEASSCSVFLSPFLHKQKRAHQCAHDLGAAN